MTDPDNRARNRYLAMVLSRLIGVAGGLFGLILLGRATTTVERGLGAAIVLAAVAVMAILPRALARRWRTPPQP